MTSRTRPCVGSVGAESRSAERLEEWGSAQAVAVLGSILRLISSPASISAFWRS
jgi:hypothetical protein